MGKPAKQHIDEKIAKRIKKLHHEHDNLGHEGIARFLEVEGIVVDEHELRLFMDEHHLDAGPTASWKSRAHPLDIFRGDVGKR
ncbi:MAG: hypothetical protein ABI559_07425 [Chloroflexota bacterium]